MEAHSGDFIINTDNKNVEQVVDEVRYIINNQPA